MFSLASNTDLGRRIGLKAERMTNHVNTVVDYNFTGMFYIRIYDSQQFNGLRLFHRIYLIEFIPPNFFHKISFIIIVLHDFHFIKFHFVYFGFNLLKSYILFSYIVLFKYFFIHFDYLASKTHFQPTKV